MEKVGRNDPCPCGSGKKYKKCCEHRNALEGRVFTPKSEEKTSIISTTTSFFHKVFAKPTVQIPIPKEEEKTS